MRFELIYSPTIMDGPVLRWQGGVAHGTYRDIFSGEERINYTAEISASRNGVIVHGHWPTITQKDDIEDFARCLGWAHTAHLATKDARDEHEVAKTLVDFYTELARAYSSFKPAGAAA